MKSFPVEDILVDANGLPFTFDGKANLRSENTPLVYTQKHLEEYRKCSDDIIYFIENYCYIQDADDGLVIPTLYDWQKDLVLTIKDNKKTIIMIPRQSGKCLCTNNSIRIRNKKTGVVTEIPIGEFYEANKKGDV